MFEYSIRTCGIARMIQPPQNTGRTMRPRIMYIERKSDGLSGPARIGRVTFSQTGKTISYNGHTLQSLRGRGFKVNYFDVDTGEEYWISGCKKHGGDRLYGDDVQIDEDVREEYWTKIRGIKPNKNPRLFRSDAKYTK